MKTRQDNDMDCIGVVYAETQIEQSRPIEPGTVCYENETRQ